MKKKEKKRKEYVMEKPYMIFKKEKLYLCPKEHIWTTQKLCFIGCVHFN
jgi:hypothetical protein